MVAVGFEKIEDAVHNRVHRGQLHRGFAHPEALLEPAEGRLFTGVRHHLAVEQNRPGPLRGHSDTNLRVGARQVLAGARLEPHLAALLARNAALAVELALQEPVVAKITTLGEGGQHQRGRHVGVVNPVVRSACCRPRPAAAWRRRIRRYRRRRDGSSTTKRDPTHVR